VKKGNYGRMNK